GVWGGGGGVGGGGEGGGGGGVDHPAELRHQVLVDLDEDGDAKVGQRHAGQREQDLGDGSHLDAPELDRRPDAEAVHRPAEHHHELRRPPEELARAEDGEAGDRDGERAEDEDPDEGRTGALAPAHAALPPDGSSALRVRNRRTLALSECSSSSLGLPRAPIVRVSVSRKMESSPIDRMLASSCDTITMVAPMMSRTPTMSSSRSREVIGSGPADGSSRKRMSGSSASARASPARFCMPPLISDGK